MSVAEARRFVNAAVVGSDREDRARAERRRTSFSPSPKWPRSSASRSRRSATGGTGGGTTQLPDGSRGAVLAPRGPDLAPRAERRTRPARRLTTSQLVHRQGPQRGSPLGDAQRPQVVESADDGTICGEERHGWQHRQACNGQWRARYRDEQGTEHSRHFDRKVDAQRWLDEVTTSIVSGTYVEPRAGDVSFSGFYDDWSVRQLWVRKTRENADLAARSVPFAREADAVHPSIPRGVLDQGDVHGPRGKHHQDALRHRAIGLPSRRPRSGHRHRPLGGRHPSPTPTRRGRHGDPHPRRGRAALAARGQPPRLHPARGSAPTSPSAPSRA